MYHSYHQSHESVPLAFVPRPLSTTTRLRSLETDPLILTPVRKNHKRPFEEEEAEKDEFPVSVILGRSMVGIFGLCLLMATLPSSYLSTGLGRVFGSPSTSQSAEIMPLDVDSIPMLGKKKKHKKKKTKTKEDQDSDDSDDETSLPKPTDQIQNLFALWQKGSCSDLNDILADDFEFQVTAFGTQDEDDEDPLHYDKDQFVQDFCEPFSGHFVVHFEDDNHNNLGPSFGTLQAFGSDLSSVPGQEAPCLAPFYASLVVNLDEKGDIQLLRELVHNLETYNEFTEACAAKSVGGNETTDSTALRHRLLKHKKHKDKKDHKDDEEDKDQDSNEDEDVSGDELDQSYEEEDDDQDNSDEDGPDDQDDKKPKKDKKHKKKKHEKSKTPNLDIAVTVSNYYAMGNCQALRPYLAPEFVFSHSIKHPKSLAGADAFIAACEEQATSMPQYFHPTTSFQDGNTVTMSGPFVTMVSGDCPVFGKESYFLSFTDSEPPLLTSMFATAGDSYLEDVKACLKE